ncbi:MAG: hypothetical protein DMD60_05160 [Gemmatimonadetes bacterium]|nr:MAG: hypothetical protein DMD60_05160 [Gemmatimonadota bacterium]
MPWGSETRETLDALRRMARPTEVPYRGYLIRPTPKQQRDSLEWTLEIHIARDRAGERREQLVNARAPTFKTFEEAIAGGVRFGQDIIDGKVPGCSVVEL